MQTIASFTVDHTKLKKGLYVSRIDDAGGHPVTTFDLRMKEPNKGEYLSTTAMHTLEHLAATFLRNDAHYKDHVLYFGPMGCRTGFYLVLAGQYSSEEIAPLVCDVFARITTFQGEVPGASAKECGNYLDLDLKSAQQEAAAYLTVLQTLSKKTMYYPD